MKMTEKVQTALDYATEKHNSQTRKKGEPFITHPIAVAEYLDAKGYGEEYIIAALFHDLLEDTDAAEEEIEAMGGKAVLKAVKLLTKPEKYDMASYIDGIKSDPIAYAVKGADRLHNLQCAVHTDDAFKLKYILETLRWYMDFLPEIKDAVVTLARSMDK